MNGSARKSVDRFQRVAPAIGSGCLWALVVAVASGVAAAALTNEPATRQDVTGEVIHLKGERGPAWGLVLLTSGLIGGMAGLAGAAWRYTRPE
jgi:hypothetical protein